MKQQVIALLLGASTMIGGVSAMADEFTVYVVRHAEKAVAESDPPLSERGLQRARTLAQMLEKAELKAIYSTPYQRTQQTVKPVAELFDISITSYRPGDAQTLLAGIMSRAENALIVGHSNTVPALVEGLGGQSEKLTEQDYGDLFQLTFYACEQQPCQVHQTRLMVPMN